GNTLEALTGAWLLERTGFRPTLDRVRDVALLAGAAAGLATLVSATLGTASLWLGGVVPTGRVLTTWGVWWAGDALGALVAAPVLFSLFGLFDVLRSGHRIPAVSRRSEALLLVAAVAAAVVVGFGPGGSQPFAVFPAVVWAALRFGPASTAAVTLTLSAASVAQTARGVGPFAGSGAVHNLWLLDGFLATVALTGLALAAVVAERNRAAAELRAADDLRLRESEERFRLAFENAPIGMALVGPDGRFLKVNRQLCQLVGQNTERLLAMTFQDITHPEDLDADLNLVPQTLTGEIAGYSMVKRYFHADGHVVWINLSVSLVRNDHGQPLYFVSQIEDITERRDAEERFWALLESAPDGMVIVDDGG